MKFLIKFPTRNRPDKFFNTLDKYINYFSLDNEFKILVSCDEDDLSMNNEKVRSRMDTYQDLIYFFSPKDSKIGAINRDLDKITYDWDILIGAADDMIPVIAEYDKIIEKDMTETYPELDGCLWYFDGHQRNINTQSIIGRNYYNKLGYIYHPSYKSVWCDNEHTEYAQSINKLKFIDKVIIVHAHPVWSGGQGWDALYAQNESSELNTVDKLNFERRKKLNFIGD